MEILLKLVPYVRVLNHEVPLLLENVHEGEALERSTCGEVRARGGGQGHEGAVDALLCYHLHHRVATAGPGVRLAARVGEWLAATRHHVGHGAVVVGEVGVGRDGGGVARPHQDVPRGVPGPGHLVLVQHRDQDRPGPDGVPGHDPVVQVHHVDQGRVDDDGQSGLEVKVLVLLAYLQT